MTGKSGLKSLEDVLISNDPQELKAIIADILKPGETIPKAFKRLKGEGRGQKPSSGFANSEDKKTFGRLTDAAHNLFTLGYSDIYNDSKEQILKQFPQRERPKVVSHKKMSKEKKSGQLESIYAENNNNLPTSTPQERWEYKIAEKLYGPFTSQEMVGWIGEVNEIEIHFSKLTGINCDRDISKETMLFKSEK